MSPGDLIVDDAVVVIQVTVLTTPTRLNSIEPVLVV